VTPGSADADQPQKLPPEIQRLEAIDWDFADAKTSYLTHSLHPYPAKYIPQIPNALIQELSGTGETVADVFCGSGTTLVEALLLKRHAVGVDANPLACLITGAKTTPLEESHIHDLIELADRADALGQSLAMYEDGNLFGRQLFRASAPAPESEDLSFWFEDHVIQELAEVKHWCDSIESPEARRLALVAFSSIIVAVSKQDSDTRYVRREKGLRPGDTLRRFSKSLRDSTQAVAEFSHLYEPRFHTRVYEANILSGPDVGQLDLVVCSPPYPNAYSYHLYHRTRMLWLGMDQPTFKQQEIGSHRKYSRKGKNGATVETFRTEMGSIFAWLQRHLRPGRYACFVVGNSTLGGIVVNNADVLAEAAGEFGFREEARIARRMKDTAKAFNPVIGKIKSEDILILRNAEGT
jgi:site-specific DNA-methyltransferase (cytosine-N4-specific)